jgi:PAS domain S-box-containing protein
VFEPPTDANLIQPPTDLKVDQEHFLRAVVDSTEDALAAFDADGCFSLCNRAFQTLFGLNARDLAGTDERSLREQLRTRLEAPHDFFEASGDNNEPDESIVRLSPQDEAQDVRVLRWYAGPVYDDARRLMGRTVMVRDITKDYELDRMKTDFVSTVSHELRTPMTSIKGYVDLILEGDTGEINDLQRQFLSTVQRNTDRLVDLINDMLDISRIESGHIEFNIRPLVLAELIEQAMDTVRPQCDAGGLTMTAEISPPEGAPPVLADADRVMQILVNLLSNAIKYTPTPPESAGLIEVKARIDRTTAHVAVRDSGIGISEHDQTLLFHKFFRAGNHDTRQTEGTGLGLSIARALVEKMGGELWVQSSPGEGSEFSFTLPVEMGRSSRRRQPRPLHQAPRVLIAYDDPDGGDALASFLKLQGYAVENAYSGTEALRMLHETHYEAVIVRLLLPHQQGFELLSHLENNPLGQDGKGVSSAFADQTPTLPLAFEPDGISGAESIHALRVCNIVALESAALQALLESHLGNDATILTVGSVPDALGTALAQAGAETLSAPDPLHALVVRDEREQAGQKAVALVILEAERWGDSTQQLVEAWGTVAYLFVSPDTGQAMWLPPAGRKDEMALRSIQERLDEMSHQRLEQYNRQTSGFQR